MKYLSGDFIAEYNHILKKCEEEQARVDKKWHEMINILVNRETARLEDTIPNKFNIGEKVRDTNGNIGTVKACPIVLNVYEDEDYYGKKFGPNRFFTIKDQSDEEAVTCEGMLRMIDVEVSATEIEKDWGQETKVARYYEDELTVLGD